MSPGSLPLSKVVRHLLSVEAGGKISTSDQGLATARKLHDRLLLVVAPVVGDAGFDALFARSIKKTKPAIPALQDLNTEGPAQNLLSQFCEHLKTQDAAALEEIIVALMVTFIGLLATFIGDGLAWKLMFNAWPDELPSEPPSGETP